MSKFINLGIFCKRKDKDSDGNIQYYIKLDKSVKLTVNGLATTSDFIQVNLPSKRINATLNKGKCTEEEADVNKAKYAPGGDLEYIKQELTVIIDD